MEIPSPHQATSSRTKRPTWLQIGMFVVGICSFLLVNIAIYAMSHPTFPNDGPMSDVQAEVWAALAVVIVIAFLGKPGRSFATGFGSGLFVMTLSYGSCAEQWGQPAVAVAGAVVRHVPATRSSALDPRKREWADKLRRNGLDEADGVRRALFVIACMRRYQNDKSEYPRDLVSSDIGVPCQEFFRTTQTDPHGWRLAYDPIAGRDGRVTRFHFRLAPDSALHLSGPFIEATEAGLVTMRTRSEARAYAKADPVLTLGPVISCIRASDSAYAVKGKRSVTLEDLIFQNEVRCPPLPLERPTGDAELAGISNAAIFTIVGASNEGARTMALYVLRYLPRRERAVDGYEIYLSPYQRGIDGLRSYLRAADGSVHVTSEDRPATAGDPLALACEVDESEPC